MRFRALLLTSCLVAATASPGFAATRTWDAGAGTTNWLTAANWSADTVPTGADTAVINLGATGPNVVTTVTTVTQVQVGNTAANGTLNISSGGVVSDTTGYLGVNAGSAGTATIDGSGSSWTNSGGFYVGNNGTGTLTIQNGGSVSDSSGAVGNGVGGSGTATIDGSGSSWTNSADFRVGNSGNGSLTVQNGAHLSNGTQGYISVNAASNSSALITGAGSNWTSSSSLYVGYGGTGTLNVQNGSTINALSGLIGNQSGSTGTATVTGAGSTWTNTAGITVGNSGTGTLNVQSGGVVSNTVGIIGNAASSTGTATVTGAGSTWTNSSTLNVGNAGSGTLNIISSGKVNTTNGVSIGLAAGGAGAAIVNGSGSLWTIGSYINVGDVSSGANTLAVQNGGTVSSASGTIGNAATSNGTATVTGAGSTWTNTANILVGNSGIGALNITNGGALSDISMAVGYQAASNGTATVTGAGSTWTNTSTAIVGNQGAGTLMISAGGLLSNTAGTIGNVSGSTGTATVTGAGSTWTNTGAAIVGSQGAGTLMISAGGLLSNTTGTIGNVSGSTGAATVTGAGSTWTNSGALTIGNSGTGTLTVSNSGTVTSAGTATIANSAGSVGTLNIGDATINPAAAPGTLSAATVAFGAGTGLLNFNHTSGAYTFAPNITGTGTLNFQAGTTILTGDMSAFTGTITGSSAFKLASGASLLSVASNSSGYAGATDVTDSTLKVNGSLGGTTTVGSGGRLQGSGTLATVTAGNGATVAPGNSIGTLTVATATFNAGSTYEVEINSAGQSDLLDVTGAATINAGTVSVIPFPDVALNTQYTILNAAGGLTGTFTGLTLNGVAGSYLFVAPSLSYDANHVYLTLASDPGGFEAVAHTPNQKAAAREATHLPFSNGAAAALYTMTDEAVARDAFDQLSGEIHASALGATLQAQQGVRDSILAAINDAPAGDSRRAWLRSYGSIGHTLASDEGNTATMASRTGGSFVGIERREEDGRLYGFALGASEQQLNQDSRHAQAGITSTHAAAYGGMELPGSAIALRGGIGASLHQIGTKREMAFTSFNETSSGDYGARSGQLFIEASRTLPIAPGTQLRPRAAASYSLTHADSFDEDGQAGLHSGEQTDQLAATELGLTIEHRLNVPAQDPSSSLAPRLTGGLTWRHQVGDLTPSRDIQFIQASSTSTGSAVQGAPLAADSLSINAGLSLDLAPNLALTADYQATAAQRTTQHNLAGKIAYRF